MKNLLQAHFAINPIEIKKLWGYANSNYLVKTKDKQYVFKIYLTFVFTQHEQ